MQNSKIIADLIYRIIVKMTRPSSAPGRRIKLDLSNFVGDGGSLRWMFVADSEVRLVSDLADKLRAEYSQLRAGDSLTLLLDGFLLPPWEPATILQSGDLVTVIRTRPAAQHQTRGTRDADTKPSTHAKKSKKSTPAKAKPQASSSSSSSDSSEDEVQPSVNANTKQVVTVESLPQELFLHICSFLESNDLFSIGSTSRKLKNSIEDVSLWKRISKIELVNFAGASTPSPREINLAVFLATHSNGEFCIYN